MFAEGNLITLWESTLEYLVFSALHTYRFCTDMCKSALDEDYQILVGRFTHSGGILEGVA